MEPAHFCVCRVELSYSSSKLSPTQAMPATASIITVHIVRKPPDQVDFTMHPHRWVVERFFGWISRNRRLWQDPEATLA